MSDDDLTPQEIVNLLDGYPTPVDDEGRCWFCGGGLGHGPHGHTASCVWTAMRKAANHD